MKMEEIRMPRRAVERIENGLKAKGIRLEIGGEREVWKSYWERKRLGQVTAKAETSNDNDHDKLANAMSISIQQLSFFMQSLEIKDVCEQILDNPTTYKQHSCENYIIEY